MYEYKIILELEFFLYDLHKNAYDKQNEGWQNICITKQ